MITIPFIALTCLRTIGVAEGFVQQEIGIVNPLATIRPSTIKPLKDSSSSSSTIRSLSAHSSNYPRLFPLNSLRGSNNDHDMDGSGTMVAEDDRSSDEHQQHGAEVSYLMDDTSFDSYENGTYESGQVEVNLLEENIGEDDMDQALAMGVVAALSTKTMISEDVYMDEESGEVYEIPNEEDDDEEDDEPPESDHGGVVSGIFGNLRIPASLLAGASLGQAFALPFADMDGLTLGMVKRVYILCMLGSFSSMLLTVLVSTTVMTDITLSNPRLAKSPADYINRYYALDYMLTKINFFAGSGVFAIGSMLRGWVFLNLATVGQGVLGIMGSFTLMTASIVLEYNRRQSGKSLFGQLKDTFLLMKNKTRTNKLFAIGAIAWCATMIWLLAKVPHIAEHLIETAENAVSPWWRKAVMFSGGFTEANLLE